MTEPTLASESTDVAETEAVQPVVAVTEPEVATSEHVGDATAATPEPAETAPAAAAPAVEAASKVESADLDSDDENEPGELEDEMHWYVLKVASNRERTIKSALERNIKRENLSEHFGEILIPTEKVKETKNGKTRIREVKLWPGYLVVQMRITDDTYFTVRGVTGVGDFTGAAGKPVPMTDDEVSRLKGEETRKEEAAAAQEEVIVVKVPYEEGQRVKVKEGAFESFEGTVDSIDQHTGKIKILVEIFGRATEMELEHWQVEKL